MLRNIILIVLILLIMSASIFAQAKVGTTGAGFLELSPSVKSNGMGQTGVALPLANSFYYNPANLGLLLKDNIITLSSYPKASDLIEGLHFRNISSSLPPLHWKNNDIHTLIGIGYYYTKLESDSSVEIDYSQGTIDGTGRVFSYTDEAHHLVLSAAQVRPSIEYSLGVTIKYFKESAHDYSTDGFAFDFGGIIRFPMDEPTNEVYTFLYSPVIGISYRNIGSKISYLTNEYDLPKTLAIGCSFEASISKKTNQDKKLNLIAVTPALDLINDKLDYWNLHTGIDISLFELCNTRLGMIDRKDISETEYTFGFSISTGRIGRFLQLVSADNNAPQSGFFDLYFSRLDIEYNFASYDRSYAGGQKFHELILKYYIGE